MIASVETSQRQLKDVVSDLVAILEIACAGVVTEKSLASKQKLASGGWVIAQCVETLLRRLVGLRCDRAVLDTTNWSISRDLSAAQGKDVASWVSGALSEVCELAAEVQSGTLVTADEGTDHALAQVRAFLQPLSAPRNGSTARLLRLRGEGSNAVPLGGTALPQLPMSPARDDMLREDPTYGCWVLAEDLSNLPEWLHSVALGIELCATEACAAMIASHPDAPWGARHDLARQMRDEARHFQLLSGRMQELGGAIGDWPAETRVWDRFRLGETLGEQILIEERIGESVGLDAGIQSYRQLVQARDEQTAAIFDFILADEVTHVAIANRWVPQLLPIGQDLEELEKRLQRRLEEHGCGVKVGLPVNVSDRLLAGYTDADLRRLEEERSGLRR